MTHVVSAFRTKLSTATSVNAQLICDRLCYWLYITWYSMIEGGNQSAAMCRQLPGCFYVESATRAFDRICCCIFSGGFPTVWGEAYKAVSQIGFCT